MNVPGPERLLPLPLRQFLNRFASHYSRVFSISEIEGQPILQWAFGALLFYFFVTFSVWINASYITVETAERGAICWPYLKNCGDFYFLHQLPYGYSQGILYMLFYGVLMTIAYYMWKQQWVRAHMLMTGLFLWKFLVLFLLSYVSGGPYDYYHIALLSMLLFVPHKEFFLKVAFVWMYFMSVTVKFTPAWVLGTYFTSMDTGIPLFPRWSIIFATNIVIFVQIVECWFLLSRNWVLQRLSLVFALFFHLYSGILVGYNYPSVTLPIIAIMFGPMYRYTPIPFNKKAIAGFCVIAAIGLFQLLGFVTPTNRYLTLEGYRFGMFMFEANHQCAATITERTTRTPDTSGDFERVAGMERCEDFYCIVKKETTKTAIGSDIELRYESATARNRCDPYNWYSRLKSLCERDPSIRSIALTFDHSINGEPFYRIVDTPDICTLNYTFFKHNEWIKLPPEAENVGFPHRNWYYYD